MAGLYIHIPFCRQRCVYCDFYFVTGNRDHNAFVDALCREVKGSAKREPVHTIYLGGGTPSRLEARTLERILIAARTAFNVTPGAEITIELNPEDTTGSYLQALKNIGFTRVSLGVQSFFNDDLQFMNRSHDAERAQSALELVAAAGFCSYSVDLIFGVPGQPVSRWAANLARVCAVETPHLSTYALTLEKRTPLYHQMERGLVTPVPDRNVTAQYQMAMDRLQEEGYEHYEISSFAKPRHRAQHNQRYWAHVNYLGLGPSAHSFWWQKPRAAERWGNIRSLHRWTARVERGQSPEDFRETLSLPTLGAEYIMLSLRTADGLDLRHLRQRYRVDLVSLKQRTLDALSHEGLTHMASDGTIVRLTEKGKHVCDGIAQQLLP